MTPANRPPQAQQSNPAAVRAMNVWLYRDAIGECGDLLASCAISLRESAYQGHDAAIRVHILHVKKVLETAIQAYNKLSALSGDERAAAGEK